MKITTYAKKVFKNEIDVFGSKLGWSKTSGIEYQYGMNKFLNTLQRKAQMNEWYEPTTIKDLDKHVEIEIKDLNANGYVGDRWVITFRRKTKHGKMIEQLYRLGGAIETMTRSENFDRGSLVSSGELESVSFVFYK